MQSKARFLSAEEMTRLNAVLTRDEFYCPQAVAAIRLLTLTRCRFAKSSRSNGTGFAASASADAAHQQLRRAQPKTPRRGASVMTVQVPVVPS